MSETRDPLFCGHLIADRRYAYGKAAAEDGDYAVAAEMFEQALQEAPRWPPACFALGEAREKLGDEEGAAEAFRATIEADPSDTQGAAARLALLGRGEPLRAMPQAYVARLFDDYAPRFAAHLTQKLHYRGPALIAAALDVAALGRRFAHALDLGCGDGLMSVTVRQRAKRLTGVDLSPAMIARARERGLYDELEAVEATGFLQRSAPAAFDCILAADALCYFGDLRPLLAASARALEEAGLFAFSIEAHEGEGFLLQKTMRFAHSRSYVEAAAREAALRPLLMRAASTRREAGADAPGLICVFERSGGQADRFEKDDADTIP